MRDTKASIGTDLGCGLCAYAAALTLRLNCEVSAGLETGNLLTDLASRFANSFSHDSLPDLLLFGALFWLLRDCLRRERRLDARALLLSALFGLFTLIGMSCVELGDLSFFFANSYQLCLSLLCLFGYTVFFYPLLRLADRAIDRPSPAPAGGIAHPVRTGALVLLLCWLPWLLCNYPASFCPDATAQLCQWVGFVPWSAHHPPLSTLFMGLCYSLGLRLGSPNFGCFLYVLLQSFFGAFVFAYGLALLLRWGLPRRMWLALLVFFATPFWGCFAQWFEKDLLYAICFALTLTLLAPVLRERRCTWPSALKIGLAALFSVMLRKTGLYELCPALLLLALLLRGKDRRNLLLTLCAVLLLSVGAERAVYPALGIRPGSVREALNIPFQQTARYVCTFPEEVTDEEREAIDAVLNYEQMQSYEPFVSDPIKNTYRGDASALGPYFRVWLRMFFKHPLCYFEAGFLKSYGYYMTGYPKLDAYLLKVYDPNLGEMGIYRVFEDFPTRFLDSLRQMFTEFPLTGTLCTAGLYAWILLFCLFRLGRWKKRAEMLLLLPSFMNWLVCIASPLSASTRYALPMIAVTPLILGWTLLNTRVESGTAVGEGLAPPVRGKDT